MILCLSPKVLGRHRPTNNREKARFSFPRIASEKAKAAQIKAVSEECSF